MKQSEMHFSILKAVNSIEIYNGRTAENIYHLLKEKPELGELIWARGLDFVKQGLARHYTERLLEAEPAATQADVDEYLGAIAKEVVIRMRKQVETWLRDGKPESFSE